MSHRAGVRAAAPIPFKDFQESDLILYVAYFLKGSQGPPSSCPWLAVSRNVCATSLNVAAERHSLFPCTSEAAQRKRKHMPEAPETQTDPADPPQKNKQSTHRSPPGAASEGERPSNLSEGREMEWTPWRFVRVVLWMLGLLSGF